MMKTLTCPEIKNNHYNPLQIVSDNNKPFITCGSLNSTKIFIHNKLNPLEPINYGDNKYYCKLHKAEIIKYYKNIEKQEKKKIIAENKLKEKLEKQKAKEELKKTKHATKINNLSENLVLSITNDLQLGCVQILKTGPNKGNPCGCKILSDNLCKRHFIKSQGITTNN